MISRNIDFPYVHNVALLLSMLEEHGISVPNAVRRAVRLTPYAVNTRYPGVAMPVDEHEYVDAMDIADIVVRWSEELL